MFDKILRKIHQLVRVQRYVMTTHADEEMFDDGLTIRDVENALLSGEVVERQEDQRSRESKYLVAGPNREGEGVVVVKIGFSGRLVIITVYLA